MHDRHTIRGPRGHLEAIYRALPGARAAAVLCHSHPQRGGSMYDGVLHRTVPAGTVVVRAEANVGAGPPPSVPDLTGDLPCSVTVDVAPGQTVTLEVSFAGGDGCLRVVDPSVPAETTVPVGESTTMPG